MSLCVLLGCPVCKTSVWTSFDVTLFYCLPLLCNSASDVLEIRWVSGRDDIVGSHDRAWGDKTQFLAELEVSLIGWLVMVEEHHVNVLERSRLVQTLDRDVARANNHLDRVAESGKIDERGDDSSEFGISFETEVLLASCLAYGIAKGNARVTNVST